MNDLAYTNGLLLRYQAGDVTGEERALVEQKLSNDKDWQAAAHSLHLTVPLPAPSAASRIFPAYTTSTKRGKPNYKLLRRLLRVGTALLTIAALCFIVLKGIEIYRLSIDKIFAQTYTPYTVPQATAVPDVNNIDSLYRQQNFAAVIKQSKKARSLDEKERLYIGLSYLQQKDYFSAIPWLSHCAANTESPYHQQAGYYLTLAYLKNEDYDNCIKQMRAIVNTPGHAYQDRFNHKMIQQVKLLKWK